MSQRKNESTARIAAIEGVVCRDVGRQTGTLMSASKGGLMAAARSLAEARSVGLITGFFVPRAAVPAAETDGPVGTAMLAAALVACGVPARIAVDAPAAAVVRAAVKAAGEEVAVDEVAIDGDGDIGRVVAAWCRADVSHAVSIERCGPSADGRPRNMRGADVSAWTAPLEDLFLAGSWARIAVGDGGNEIGMGRLSADLIARTVPNGAEIACVVSCDHLIVAGVSNWGAYGLMASLAVLRPEWRAAIASFLSPARDLAVTRAIVQGAGAVDGVTARPEATVDGLGPEVHGAVIAELARIAVG
jgi:hypothetical protein